MVAGLLTLFQEILNMDDLITWYWPAGPAAQAGSDDRGYDIPEVLADISE